MFASASATESPRVTFSGSGSFDFDDGALLVDALHGFDKCESFLLQTGAVVQFQAGPGFDEIHAGLLRVDQGDLEASGREDAGDLRIESMDVRGVVLLLLEQAIHHLDPALAVHKMGGVRREADNPLTAGRRSHLEFLQKQIRAPLGNHSHAAAMVERDV